MIRTVKRPDDRKREIIASARRLFLEKDYEKTTMEDIMVDVGIAKGTVYHHFKSKDALLSAVVDDLVGQYVCKLKETLDQTKGDALHRLAVLIEASNVSSAERETLEAMHREGNVALHTRQLAVLFSQLAPLIAGVIEEGCKEGIFQTEHPLEVAELFLCGIQFMTDVGIYPWKEEDLKRRAMTFPGLLEQQLHAPKGSFDFLKSG